MKNVIGWIGEIIWIVGVLAWGLWSLYDWLSETAETKLRVSELERQLAHATKVFQEHIAECRNRDGRMTITDTTRRRREVTPTSSEIEAIERSTAQMEAYFLLRERGQRALERNTKSLPPPESKKPEPEKPPTLLQRELDARENLIADGEV